MPTIGSKAAKKLSKFSLLVLSALMLAGCKLPTFFGYRGSTTQAQDEFKLWSGAVVAGLAVGAIVWALIFWCVIFYRRRRRGDAIPKQFNHNYVAEVFYTGIPIIIVIFLFAFTVLTENNVDYVSKNPDVTVHVTAFQWGWKFDYVNYKGQNINYSIVGNYDAPPTAVMPSGETIRIILTSNDVVHGFYVPQFNFSRYAQPGITNIFDLNILQPGVYPGRCTQLCGVYHTLMKFNIKALSAKSFNSWIKSKVKVSA
jgi:cytochrome c oxidase subunit 2